MNFGHASGKEIYDLSEEIMQSVMDKFGIELEREVNLIWFIPVRISIVPAGQDVKLWDP